MDLGSLLVGLGTLFVFIAPIFWLQWSEKAKQEKRVQQFKNQALSLGIEIDQLSTWSDNYCLGLGNKGLAVIYFNQRQLKDQLVSIDLTSVKACILVVESHKLTRDGEKLVIIDKISLVFKFWNTGTPERSIIFFDSDSDPSVTNELDLAKDWEQRISSVIKTLSPVMRKSKAAA